MKLRTEVAIISVDGQCTAVCHPVQITEVSAHILDANKLIAIDSIQN